MLQAQEALRQSNETIAGQSQLLTQAEDNLKRSNAEIMQQSKTLTWLWIFSGGLVSVLILDGICDLVKK